MEISINHAFELWDKYYLPVTVKSHSISVIKVAIFLSQKYLEKDLITKEQQLRIIISAILHDLLKSIDIYKLDKKNYIKNYSPSESEIKFHENIIEKYKDFTHEDAVYEELKNDYPIIAKIIKSHKFFNVNNLKDLEEEIVYYADKRDDFGKITNVAERMIRAHLRYTHRSNRENNWEKVIKIDNDILDLEKELFSKVDAEPKDCNKLNNTELKQLFKDYNIDKDQNIEG